MIIQNFDHCYQVMGRLGGTETTEEFLCTELTSREALSCLLVRVVDPALAKNFTLFLDEKAKNGEFTDYQECFQEDGYFYAVFRYSLDQSLIDRLLSESLSLTERVEIVRGLLERLLLLNPHPYFAVQALRPEQITVSRSLRVSWNYHLEDVGRFESCTGRDVCQSLLPVLRILLAEEEKKGLYPLLEDYFSRLEQGKGLSYLELYQSFLPVYGELLGEPEGEQTPGTFGFRLWERVKKLLRFCRKVLAVLILGAAVWYVIHSFQDHSGAQVVDKTIRQIGELMIE